MMDFRKKRELTRELLSFCVREEERSRANDLFERFHDDALAVELLYTHYTMPPGREDMGIVDLRLLGQRRGLFLIVACGDDESHLYLLSSDGAEYLGTLADARPDAELVAIFGPELPQRIQRDRGELPSYLPLRENEATCPACHCSCGELHELGCPVELCPWCGGQLIHCGCRFEQLGRDVLDEHDLDELIHLLEQHGRIPFTPEQRPRLPRQHRLHSVTSRRSSQEKQPATRQQKGEIRTSGTTASKALVAITFPRYTF